MNRSQVIGEINTRVSLTKSFSYDGSTSTGPGNPTSFKGVASTFNSNNQVTNAGFSYDGNGNPTTYTSVGTIFDPENRLLQTNRAGLTEVYTYDGDGHQVLQNAYGLVKSQPRLLYYKLYDGENLVSLYGAANLTSPPAVSRTNTVGADGLISVCNTIASTFYTFDERGNVAQRLDNAASVQSSDVYDASGKVTTTISNITDFVGFGGQVGYYTDNYLSLVPCTHRYYDPKKCAG